MMNTRDIHFIADMPLKEPRSLTVVFNWDPFEAFPLGPFNPSIIWGMFQVLGWMLGLEKTNFMMWLK